MRIKIEQWIDQTNNDHTNKRVCCDRFSRDFTGFYSDSFLARAYFVVVPKIPKPDFPELRQKGLGGFIDMSVEGITYKNTYYVLPHVADSLNLHFHELVHVAQWSHLGATNFIQRYITEIQGFGYERAPLEQMACNLETHFGHGGEKVDIPNYVSKKI